MPRATPNHVEVVDMRPFRGRAHWDFFMTVERADSFMRPIRQLLSFVV